MENKINKTHYLKRFASCAVMLSLATVLSIFPSINAPLGGSITIGSMVPIMLISLLYGMKWGVPVAIGYSCIQLLLGISAVASWGLSIGVFIGCIFLDYSTYPCVLRSLYLRSFRNKIFEKCNYRNSFILFSQIYMPFPFRTFILRFLGYGGLFAALVGYCL